MGISWNVPPSRANNSATPPELQANQGFTDLRLGWFCLSWTEDWLAQLLCLSFNRLARASRGSQVLQRREGAWLSSLLLLFHLSLTLSLSLCLCLYHSRVLAASHSQSWLNIISNPSILLLNFMLFTHETYFLIVCKKINKVLWMSITFAHENLRKISITYIFQ